MKPEIIPESMLARLLATSYRNFHAKGVDYVCLQRAPALTLKVYFFEQAAGQVVNPHDHRYDFASTVIRGSVRNTLFDYHDGRHGLLYDRWQYLTPLNQEYTSNIVAGFAYKGQARLRVDSSIVYQAGQTWRSLHQIIHALEEVQPGTVMAIEQYHDVVPLNAPTHTYTKPDGQPKPPDLTGLYDAFTVDQMMARLRQLESISPGALSWLKE